MTFRSRTNVDSNHGSGTVYHKNGSSYPSAAYPAGFSTCEDNTAPGDGQQLLVKHHIAGSPSAHLQGTGDWVAVGGSWTPLLARTQPWGIGAVTGQVTIDYIAVKAMAATNPSRPVADIPVAIFELHEIVSLIRTTGSNIFSQIKKKKEISSLDPVGIAQANLLYQFGIKPLISDLQAILDFQEHVDKRVEDLKDLFAKGGLSKTYRKKIPFHAAGTVSGMVTVNSLGPFLRCQRIYKTEEKSWGFAKWNILEGTPFPKNESAMRELARKSIYGLTLDASTVWEAIPWSWLVDYAIGVGAFLSAHRNIVPAKCTVLYVCRHATTECIFGDSRDSNLVVTGWTNVSVRKSRTPVAFVTPAAHLPFLNGTQMSIIASLGILRLR